MLVVITSVVSEHCSKPSISDGSVSPSTNYISNGAIYTATCNSGYTLDGSATMSCNDGTLSTAPTCTGNLLTCNL